MTTTPLTMAEYEEAGGGGDTICQCGYRKSQHGPNHPAPDSHNPSQCNNRRFARSELVQRGRAAPPRARRADPV